LVTLRRPAVLLLAAVLAAACRDPSPSTGTLVVDVTGLPAGAKASVRVTGPNQFIQLIPATTTLENLVPGEYIVVRDTVLFQGTRYGVADVKDTITVATGRTESAPVPYAIASGSLTITLNGLQSGTVAGLRVRGPLPNGPENSNVQPGQVVTGLRPGQYEITFDTTFNSLGDRFAPVKLRDTVVVPASVTPVQASAMYVQASGTLALTVNGLPASGTLQPVSVSGPGEFLVLTGQSITLRGLDPGTYTISPTPNVTGVCPNFYTTSNTAQSFDVAIGATATATVDYTASQVSMANLNLTIDKVVLTQATQSSSGTIPLISGKTALLRVFGVANQCNNARPKVRVTLSTGPIFEIDAQEDSVRIAPQEGSLLTTWNVVLPGTAIQAGMSVVAEMDVTNGTAEANETDNRFPASGSKAIDVRTVPVLGLRVLAITQSVNGLTGAVSAANLSQFLALTAKIYPVAGLDVDIRPYTTNLPALLGGDSDAALTTWANLVSEIASVRNADQSNRYYYGVVRVNYNSGTGGIASAIGGTAAIGVDVLPYGSDVMAHELGHTFGRRHTPCGNPFGVDPSYPYPGGGIGVPGWDPNDGLKRATGFTDVMGYCTRYWISDYTYLGVWNWLTDPARGPTTGAMVGTAQPSLLIWGRIVNGQPVLEPAFEISARPAAVAAGPHRITALDDTGRELFSIPFAAERVVDGPADHEVFSFTVPLSALRGATLASLRLTARGRTVSSVPAADVGTDPAVNVTRVAPDRARIRWDAERFPVVMVRDPENGHVLSFARGGDATIVTGGSTLELNFSNRVSSSRRLQQFK
jgi:hypothetical protein